MSCWYFAIIASVIFLVTETVSTKLCCLTPFHLCNVIVSRPCCLSKFYPKRASRQIFTRIWLTSAVASQSCVIKKLVNSCWVISVHMIDSFFQRRGKKPLSGERLQACRPVGMGMGFSSWQIRQYCFLQGLKPVAISTKDKFSYLLTYSVSHSLSHPFIQLFIH